MMKFLGLVRAGLFRRPVRSLLTIASILVAFLLFGLLQSVTVSFNSGIILSGADRLVVAPKYSIIDDIPVSYGPRIAGVPGVVHVTHLSWFGGTYKDAGNFFPRWPVDTEAFFEVYPELDLPEDRKAAFKSLRTAAIIGTQVAETHGIKVGDKIPLIPNIWPNKDKLPWEFDVVGVYDSDDPLRLNEMFINYEYFDEYRAFGQGTVGQFVVRIRDPSRNAEIARQIDALFANSSDETKTQTEKAYNQMFANQIGDIALIMTAILSAVFFTILLLTGNTMVQSLRERIPELAILKTVGFSNRSVLCIVLAEAIMIVLVGSLPGLAIAALIIEGLPVSTPFLGGMSLPGIVVAEGVLVAILLGVLVGLPPAVRANRLSIVEALGEHK